MTDFEQLYSEYEITPLDDDEMVFYKTALKSLPEAERRIFTLYMELGTYTSVARLLKSSPPTAKKVIDNIRKKILNYDS